MALNPPPSRPKRTRLELVALESRLAPSVTWVNRGDPSDHFAATFGAGADAARAAVDAVVDSFERAFTDFRFPGDDFALRVVALDAGTGFGGTVQVNSNDVDADGRIRGGTLFVKGGDGKTPLTGGYFVDPTPGESGEFVDGSDPAGVVNAFVADAVPGGPAEGKPDFVTVVGSQLARLVGLTSGLGTRFTTADYTDLTRPDKADPGRLFYWNRPGGGGVTITTSDGGADSGAPAHVARPQPDGSGVVDLGNATLQGGRRYLISDLFAGMIGDMYGYGTAEPSSFGTFYAHLNGTTGELLVRGKDGADRFEASVEGKELVVTTEVAGAAEGRLTSRFRLADVKSLAVRGFGGDDEFELSGELAGVAASFDGGAGANTLSVVAPADPMAFSLFAGVVEWDGGSVRYSGTPAVTVEGRSGADVFEVLPSPATRFVVKSAPRTGSGNVLSIDPSNLTGTQLNNANGTGSFTSQEAAPVEFAGVQSVLTTGGVVRQTVTQLTALPSPAEVGRPVTLTAGVRTAGGPVDGGTVEFFDGQTSVGTAAVAAGSASITLTQLAAGEHQVTAVYSGQPGFSPSTSPAVPVTVSALPLTVTLLTLGSPNPAVPNTPAVLVAVVTAASGVGRPGGTVVFTVDGRRLGEAAVGGDGTARLTTDALRPGEYAFGASYLGAAGFSASASEPVAVRVTRFAPTLSMSGPPTPSVLGTPLAFTAVVSSPAGPATGEVRFLSGETVVGTATLDASGAATFTTTDLPVGVYSVRASYAGDDLTEPIEGRPVVVMVISANDGGGTRPGLKTLVVSGAGGTADAYTFDGNGRSARLSGFTPFVGVPGVVRVAPGDFNGDGFTDYAAVTGPGGGDLVRLINGRDGSDLLSGGTANAYAGENFTTIGLFVSAGDIDGDGRAEVVVSPDRGGGARVQVFSLQGGTLAQRANFFAIDDPNFRGGGRIATGDVNGDGRLDLVVGAGFGGGPRIALYDGASLTAGGTPRKLVGDFLAFEPTLRNGTWVAAGDVTGDGKADLVFGGGPGGGPRVLALDAARVLAAGGATPAATPVANFFAFDAGQRGGVRVTVKDVDDDDRLDLVVGTGEGTAAQVKTYAGTNLTGSTPPARESVQLIGYSGLRDGVFVG